MSHITELKVVILDLNDLKIVAEKLGLEFKEDQKTFRWYANSKGKCDHALSVKGKANAYEIGITKNPNAAGYTLKSDFFMGGQGLEDCVGKNGSKLNQNYSARVAIKQARRDGFRVQQSKNSKGDILLKLSQ